MLDQRKVVIQTCLPVNGGGGHLKLNHSMSGDLFVQEYIFKTFCISHFLLKSIDS